MAPPDNRPWDVQPSDAKQALAADKYEDCMSCKVMGTSLPYALGYAEKGNYYALDTFSDTTLLGSGAFIGLGVYSYYTGMNNLRQQEKMIMQSATKYKMGSRRLGIATISATMIGAGVWRAFN
ncbi:hypothetical protein N7533_009240 [Penicillium manginii]|uniref:uncharacterized protein n=1 Tax=Penicillium manginii TaxID=203109 RepID=UPI0025467DB9|nr:uncharacterized protein N7533_009240 [Penicillium manginii]KAJ5744370.1 hypothetical protein N7533_009240 [Penicillium manginii]